MSLRKKIPSVNALVTFEAAFRMRSFTRAAEELGVSQAAVSRQVSALEKDLECNLFVRAHRSVIPTVSGHQLGERLTSSFALIVEAMDALRSSKKKKALVVGASLAFTQYWLLPRLQSFRARYPELSLRVVSQDTYFDLQADEVDVGVQFGVGRTQRDKIFLLRKDRVFPVCSPEFLARYKGTISAQKILDMPLIGNDAPYENWMSWKEWFACMGISRSEPSVSLHFSHYTDCVSAALAGEGVILGWEVILEDLLAKKKLVPLSGLSLNSSASYHLVLPRHAECDEATENFILWLAEQFGLEDDVMALVKGEV